MDLVRQLLSVFMVLALLGGSLWWLRRRSPARFSWPGGGKRNGRRMESVERLALGPQHALHLVRMGDRGLVVAVHAGGCTLIDSRPWPEWESRLPVEAKRAPTVFGAAQ
ncbi:MAG: FliO/MopB family protein [Bryobacteraceae bacterium]|nr:FliO/MopB family protein [Bryobacteraceae bacterium]